MEKLMRHLFFILMVCCTTFLRAESHTHQQSDEISCKSLKACKARIKKLKAEKAKIKELTAEQILALQLQVEKLQADAAQINGTLTVENLQVDTVTVNDNAFINGDVEITGNLTVDKLVSNKVGRTYVVGVDIPTIQAGVDLANSGLKPDAAVAGGDKNVIISIPKGVYRESIMVDTDYSDPVINDPATDLFSTKGRGLHLDGDLRPIAAMTYMFGGLVRTDASFATPSGPLGTLNAMVTLSNSGNTITVTLAPVPPATTVTQPDFAAAGVVPGDTIIVSDSTGVFQERTVVSVSGNSVTYSDGPVTITAKGAALTFAPNVRIIGANPDLVFIVTSGAVETVGIWFSIDPAFASNSGYEVYVEGTGNMYASRLLIDARNSATMLGILTFGGGQLRETLADGNRNGHITVIGGIVDVAVNSHLGDSASNWYIMARPGQLRCFLGVTPSTTVCASIQMNGANKTSNGVQLQNQAVFQTGLFTAFNCNNALTAANQSFTVNTGLFIIDNCNIGLNGSTATITNTGVGTTFGLNPTINNASTAALQLDLTSQFETSRSLVISNSAVGVKATTGSLFNGKADVIFTTVTDPYAVDESSIYITPNNAGTNPSPSDIFTYTTAGPNQVMNSVYLKQVLDSPGSVGLVLNPGLLVSATPIYRGKVYTLTATTAGPHTLTLSSGSFVQGGTSRVFSGIGATMTIEVISSSQVSILTSTNVF